MTRSWKSAREPFSANGIKFSTNDGLPPAWASTMKRATKPRKRGVKGRGSWTGYRK